jgi:hypothetical protein
MGAGFCVLAYGLSTLVLFQLAKLILKDACPTSGDMMPPPLPPPLPPIGR